MPTVTKLKRETAEHRQINKGVEKSVEPNVVLNEKTFYQKLYYSIFLF
jgi:hypothetical protein